MKEIPTDGPHSLKVPVNPKETKEPHVFVNLESGETSELSLRQNTIINQDGEATGKKAEIRKLVEDNLVDIQLKWDELHSPGGSL